MSEKNRFKEYHLAQPHDESIIDRNKTLENTHPAWIEYKKEIADAWNEYQRRLEYAMIKRDDALRSE